MTFDQCVTATAKFGVTERQARFLVTVMQHGGVCVPRQYAQFAKRAYGHTVSRFFDKLVRRRWGVVCDCTHNRAQLYHVRHQALYRAIGDPESRYRRPVSTRLAIERLMVLDAMLESPDLSWLGTEAEKVAFFGQRAPSLPSEWLPHKRVGPFPGRIRFSTRQCRVLYRRWWSDGDRVFELVSSPAIANALTQGAGRIESRVLPFSYRHLSPSIEPSRSVSQGSRRETQRPHGLDPRSPNRVVVSPRRFWRRRRADWRTQITDALQIASTRRVLDGAAVSAAPTAVPVVVTAEPWRERPRSRAPAAVSRPAMGSLTPWFLVARSSGQTGPPAVTAVCTQTARLRARRRARWEHADRHAASH